MTTADEWQRLLDHLNTWAAARETPTGIEVTFEQPTGGSRTVELVITPNEWSAYWGPMWGDQDSAAANIRDLLTNHVPLDKAFLVYDLEQWEASDTHDFPADPDEEFQPEPGGQWVATDRDGNITSRYANWVEGQ